MLVDNVLRFFYMEVSEYFPQTICYFLYFKLSLLKSLLLLIEYNVCIMSIPDKIGWPLEQQIMRAYIRHNKPNGVHTM